MILAGAIVAVLFGYTSGVVTSLAGFATAIALIAAAVISWENVVLNARSEGLVETRRPTLV